VRGNDAVCSRHWIGVVSDPSASQPPQIFSLSDVIPGQVDVRWLLAGVLLEVASKAVRSRGWFNILRASFPRARELRARDVLAASFAASGLNGLLPARCGDLVKLAFVHRRIDGARYSTLIATAVPETAFESLFGAALVVWMLIQGALPTPNMIGELRRAASACPSHAAVAAPLVLAALVVGFELLRRLRRRCIGSALETRRGLAIFATPVRFVVQVASWQALARVIRLGSLLCFLAAFALPATFGAAVLVMAAQGGGRVLPLGPLSTGLRIAMLSYGLVVVVGQPVNPVTIAAFSLGQSAAMTAVMFVIAAAITAREFGTRSPRRAMQQARMCLHGPPIAVGEPSAFGR
jgi:Lysylphosphatidylglycerol synthase TM region